MPDIWMDVDAALGEVPVNIMPLIDDTDFKAIEGAVAYNAAGMALRWHFVTCAGAYTVTSVTPTTGGDYDWTDQGDSGIYTIEIPASGGASINNDTEGFGWFTGVATGVLPWRGPVIGFRAAGLNDKMIETAYSTTRGLAGTALPDAAADAAGGLPISDTGSLDMDDLKADVTAILADTGTDGVVLAADAITAAKIADDAISSEHIATGALTADGLAADFVDEIVDEVMEGTVTLRQAIRLILSVLTGKSSGGGTSTIVFRDIGDSKDRISATVDASGNRTAVGTRDGS